MYYYKIKIMKRLLRILLFSILTLGVSDFIKAQSCSVNAGGSRIVCGSTVTLVGGVTGTVGAGTPQWTFISGPTTPTIVTPTALTTNVTGMVDDGNYVFQLSRTCNVGNASSQVTITAHPRPASFTAGPDVTNICATVGTTPLAGVIPAGFTGQWRSVNIYSHQRFNTFVSTNSTFSSTTVANPTFSIINKANHEIDPAYYTILRITSLDGNCSYEDTSIVRFIPNPNIVAPTTLVQCRNPDNTRFWIDLDVTSPGFATNYTGSAGTVVAGTTVSINVTSQPSGANITYAEVEGRRIYFNGMTVDGTYEFTITITNSCGTFTTPLISYTFSGTTPQRVNFQLAAHPEQLVVYATVGSGGEFHCTSKIGTTTPETFYFAINPADPATVVTTVEATGVIPPGGAPTISSITGAGTYDRFVTVAPPASGWQVGTYRFNVTNSNGSCTRTQTYYIHISDGNRPNVAVPDQSICYPGTGSVSATIPLPAIYKQVVNGSYFQDYNAHYNISSISRPSGAAMPTYTTTNLRSITSTSTVISNLDRAGDYVFAITAVNTTGGVGPFLTQEYACSGTSLTGQFTIHVENRINSNAGSDQSGVCSQSVSLLANSPGLGTGVWQLVSSPAGTSPVITDPSSFSTTATALNGVGEYRFKWVITSPLGGCVSEDEVIYNVTCALPVSLSYFEANKANQTTKLSWATASEQNNLGFEIERSSDGTNWSKIDFINSKAENGNSIATLEYGYVDNTPLTGTNYYRLKQVDFDGKHDYSQIRTVRFNNSYEISVYPNPTSNNITVEGLKGGETIYIINSVGQTLHTVKSTGRTRTIDLKNITSGILFVKVADASGQFTDHIKVLKK